MDPDGCGLSVWHCPQLVAERVKANSAISPQLEATTLQICARALGCFLRRCGLNLGRAGWNRRVGSLRGREGPSRPLPAPSPGLRRPFWSRQPCGSRIWAPTLTPAWR